MAGVPHRPAAERRLARHFVAASAVSMADAIAYTCASAAEDRAFARLKGADVLCTDGQGRWWLDEAQWRQRRSHRRTRAVLALIAFGAVAAAAALR
ncbi:hypothetical protein [Erythrobacter neustonensis]|uniref:Uncharacterized protein n=1 Tax=Erythrobacter neustonensis TaxID=1112 RepID=A0A192D6M1_9SPHN|nr:hypothetical protein [Erythrobacter neustonensis]ANK13512.1 hypothetical protein A9D12_11840 [Erythrobacter neustonensis]